MAWNRKPEDTASPMPKKTNTMRGLLVGLIVIVLAAIVALITVSGKAPRPSAKPTKKPAQIKEVKPKVTSRENAAQTPVTNAAPKKTYFGHVIVSETAVTNGCTVITTRIAEDGQILRSAGWVTPEPIFDLETDRRISLALESSASPGCEMPPLPPTSANADAEFLKSLETPIIVFEKDSEEVKAKKRAVIEARIFIKDAMDAGGHFNDILENHRNWHNDNAVIYGDAAKAYRKMKANGEDADAEAFRSKANAILEKRGAAPITDETGRRHGKSKE